MVGLGLWLMRNTPPGAPGSFRGGSSAGNSHPNFFLVLSGCRG
jgi:hypothetical protein